MSGTIKTNKYGKTKTACECVYCTFKNRDRRNNILKNISAKEIEKDIAADYIDNFIDTDEYYQTTLSDYILVFNE